VTDETGSRVRERADYINALPADARLGIRERMRRVDALGDLLTHLEDEPLPDAKRQAELVEFLRVEYEEARFSREFCLRHYGVPSSRA
jgi:hypothetical protein